MMLPPMTRVTIKFRTSRRCMVHVYRGVAGLTPAAWDSAKPPMFFDGIDRIDAATSIQISTGRTSRVHEGSFTYSQYLGVVVAREKSSLLCSLKFWLPICGARTDVIRYSIYLSSMTNGVRAHFHVSYIHGRLAMSLL